MRILHVSEAFGGGLRTAVGHYIAATPEMEHTVLARVRVGHETTDVDENATFVAFDGSIPQFLAAARREIRDGGYDVVHLHSSYAGILRAMVPSTAKIAYSPHCFAMEAQHGALAQSAYWAVEKLMSRRRQVLVAVSERERDLGLALNPRLQTHIVENAVMHPRTDDEVERTRGLSMAPDGPRTVSMLGRVSAQKDPAFFAAVASHFDPSVYTFRWIGEGDEDRAALEEAGVAITGWLTPELTHKELLSTDLYVHTAAWEGGPLATLEAADAGCPLMSRSIPSMLSLGYHCVGETPDEVADHIRDFFESEPYRRAVVRDTERVRDRFTFERMSHALHEMYLRVASLGQADRHARLVGKRPVVPESRFAS